MSNNLLFELQTEELPPKSLSQLISQLVANVRLELNKVQIDFTDIRGFATPRRLALIVTDMAARQPDQVLERRGPALQAALDQDGEPTKALGGFLRSCGLTDISQLQQQETPKGTWLVYEQHKAGAGVGELIEAVISQSLANLPIDRKMRWGATRTEFVRPVHSAILLYGDEVLPARFFDCDTGRVTLGHRFMGQGETCIASANDYIEALRAEYVIVDFEERKSTIRQQLQAIATQENASIVIDENLLDEVTALVEWPVALSGGFDPAFLSVPEEALISAMKSHQRYFHLVDKAGKLLPRFVTVANIRSTQPDTVIKGNERVISPRLSDAAFFFRRDQESPLQSNLVRLESIVFQAKLGTYRQKAQRISALAGFIAEQTGIDVSMAQRAGLLCKADLVTGMVGEFPELQGLMGSYYARHDGEALEVAEAIKEHYLPTFSGGELPQSGVGQAVAIADKLDTLTGLFGIGQPPTGSKDPFALRRQALGVIRICIESGWQLDVKATLSFAATQHNGDFGTEAVYDYMLDRLGSWYQDQGIPTDSFAAVRNSNVPVVDLRDCDFRVRAIQAFRQQPLAASLVAANKRVANILKKTNSQPAAVDPGLFIEAAERQLHDALGKAKILLQAKHSDNQAFYEQQCLVLAGLQAEVDRYFAGVMVMADDPAIRANRIAMLYQMRDLFLGIADFSLLQD